MAKEWLTREQREDALAKKIEFSILGSHFSAESVERIIKRLRQSQRLPKPESVTMAKIRRQ
jgi:hypothetical protein